MFELFTRIGVVKPGRTSMMVRQAAGKSKKFLRQEPKPRKTSQSLASADVTIKLILTLQDTLPDSALALPRISR